jgi:hypothetical protein
MDVRFSRMINRIQQYLLMELNKIAMIHLYIMGLTDEIGNFTLSLNNPSAQIEALELQDLTTRLTAMQTAVADPGTGIPMMSMHKALKEIMKMSDAEIKEMFLEIRFEKAMAAELAATANIIKKTGMFDNVDRIYGDYEAMNGGGQTTQAGAEGEDGGLGGGGGMGALGGGLGDMGGDMDLGEPGTEGEGDLTGNMGETDMGGAPDADAGTPLMEGGKRKLPLLNEVRKRYLKEAKSFTEKYFDGLASQQHIMTEITDFNGKNATMEERIKQVFNTIDGLVNEEEIERENIINETMSALSITENSITNDGDDDMELI